MRRPRNLALVTLLAFACALGLHAGERVQTVEALGPISLQQVASGFSQPVGIVHAGDSRLFIVEQTGRIRILNGGTTLAAPFLNVSTLLSTGGFEEGLLGLAFHPDYPATPFFYIYYVNTNGDLVLARYSVSANPNIADPGSGVVMLTVPHPVEMNHNGGQLNFGPDGYLYIAIGDGGSAGDPGNDSQSTGTLLGKMLRLDVDQSTGIPPYYGIPATNPFAGATPGLDEIWAYGLRNPWRFSFDSLTGDLLIADVGQGDYEEIDFQAAGSPGGENYGWRVMEGTSCYLNEPPGCFSPSFTPPALEYDHLSGDCSVTGGFVYRGFSASYVGEYIFGDFCTGNIWHATPGVAPWPRTLLLDSPHFISSFGEDVNGELYIADLFGGTIQRLLFEDTDNDNLMDQADNCPAVSNASQINSDGNLIDQTPPSTQNDLTWINSDGLGDACDDDDDNDGLADAAEAAGCNGSGPLSATNRDFDGDRFLDGPECAEGTNPADGGTDPGDRPPLDDCAPAGDTDGDLIVDSIEVCKYNSNPASSNSDGDACGDGREVASLNGDATVNPADMGLLAAEMLRVPPPAKLVNMDLNKDGVLNPADQGLLAGRYGACP